MTPETVLGLILAVGPYPGGTLYSQTPVSKDDPAAVSVPHEDKGRTFRAYRLSEAACSQKGPACARPHYNAALRRWERAETYLEGLDRYWQISNAIAAAKPSPEVLDAAVVVFRHESGMFRRDVHEGTNHRPFRTSTPHEDGGLAWGFGQIHWSNRPEVYVPVRGFRHIRLGELVGLSDRSTALSVAVPIVRLTRIVKQCKGKGAVCVFVGYGGTVSAKHPLIKARVATAARVRKLTADQRSLSAKVRVQLGLKKEPTS